MAARPRPLTLGYHSSVGHRGILDGDDWWAKRKLAVVAEAFEANPGVAAVGHGFYEVRDANRRAKCSSPGKPAFLI